ncbi:YdeI family protein [Paradesertivirga mongoliensis]|uniref:YdeI family protein n=1 Tax=Paradesertivirga mongoliensis TaxID=2100740 RepID=A0ABW4ZQJ2_9SPHI|nr:hypothetical protein [Pedobacter mongoliensis]
MQLTKPEAETFYAKDRQEWRQWLKDNHTLKQSVWLVQYKKQSNIPSISWSEAVDEALCFGWIDSTRKSVDDRQFVQFFTKRKANSMWSKINKAKVEQLIKDGLMEKRVIKASGLQKLTVTGPSWMRLRNWRYLRNSKRNSKNTRVPATFSSV